MVKRANINPDGYDHVYRELNSSGYQLERRLKEDGYLYKFVDLARLEDAQAGIRRFVLKILKQHRGVEKISHFRLMLAIQLNSVLLNFAQDFRQSVPGVLVDSHRLFQLPDYLLVDYLPGVTLPDIAIGYRDTDSIEARVAFFKLYVEFINFISCLNERGYFHADLSLHNLVLDNRNWLINAIDWDTARPVGVSDYYRERMRGGLVGTPGYVAPELASFEDPDSPRTDLYALAMGLGRIYGLKPIQDIFEQTDYSTVTRAVFKMDERLRRCRDDTRYNALLRLISPEQPGSIRIPLAKFMAQVFGPPEAWPKTADQVKELLTIQPEDREY